MVFLIALIVALGAALAGPGRVATKVRRVIASAPRRLRDRLRVGSIGRFVLHYTAALRVVVIAVPFLVLLLLDTPSLGVVILLVTVTVVLLFVVEMLRAAAMSQATE